MNDLNSILLEGKVVDNQLMAKQCRWVTIRSRRYFRDPDPSIGMQSRSFDIRFVCHGKEADRMDGVMAGRYVRVVGKLDQYGDIIYIEAEHIELRPPRSDESE